MARFVIRWATYGYVTRGQPNRKPYAQDRTDPDVQTWASHQGAERFLSRKDPQWAAACVIEALPVASERALCPRCGEPARQISGMALVRAVIEPDGSRGRVIRVDRFEAGGTYYCGGGHPFAIGLVKS
jgi:hypothetical protein